MSVSANCREIVLSQVIRYLISRLGSFLAYADVAAKDCAVIYVWALAFVCIGPLPRAYARGYTFCRRCAADSMRVRKIG